MDHLSKEILSATTDRLNRISSSLDGLSGLFSQGSKHMCLDESEFYGLGQILKIISLELQISEDILRCGYSSDAKMKNKTEQGNDK